jgi:hypothetical protein
MFNFQRVYNGSQPQAAEDGGKGKGWGGAGGGCFPMEKGMDKGGCKGATCPRFGPRINPRAEGLYLGKQWKTCTGVGWMFFFFIFCIFRTFTALLQKKIRG